MTEELATVLLIDISAIMAGRTLEWQEYWRVGQCYLPQVVYEEIQFFCNRAPDPNQEQTAREFMRFFPSSGWTLATAHATHPNLTPPSGQAISKRARLALATAQCVYGLSQEQPDKLVVFVANNQPLLQKIPALGASNLCGITTTALLQWSRTGQRPPAVSQQMQAAIKANESSGRTQQPRAGTGVPPASASSRPTSTGSPPAARSSRSTPTSAPLASNIAQAAPSSSRPASRTATMTGPASAARMPSTASRQRTAKASSPLKGLSSLLVLAGIAIASLFAWRTIHPASFNQTWRQLGLPPLPGDTPAKPIQKPVQKPVKK